MVESREELTYRRGKKKNKGMMTVKSMSDSKWARASESLSDSGQTKQMNKQRARKKSEPLDMFRLDASANWQTLFSLHWKRTASEGRKKGSGIPREMFTHSAQCSGFYDLLTLWTAGWVDSVQTEPLCGPTWRPRQWNKYCKTGAYCS